MDRAMTKLEEALEIKSLRRVICAYLNYASAMEQDVARWARLYAKLRPAHKELLSHLPKKYEELRRCLSANFCFILNMLQAFEPPFDMSQDFEIEQASVFGQPERDHFVCTKGADHASTCTGPQCGLVGRGNDKQSFFSNKGSPRKLKNVDDNYAGHLETTDIRTSSALGTARSEPFDTASVHAPDNGLYYKDFDFVSSLNRTDGESVGIQTESRPERDDMRRLEFPAKPASNKKVIICGMDLQDPAFQLHVPPADVDKVRCIIRNIVRDWTEEGALERNQCYKPIMEELERCFPNRSKERPPCCLVPGAGLARLACEISCLGFVCQGNEFSYYMLICSSFILNNTQAPLESVIYPWIHSNCNMVSDSNQLQPVYFPDLHPGSAGITEGFSMCAGDFVEVYSHSDQQGTWDAVATCFFIDTAHNIVEYIEIISKVLKPGGVWINLGPLLYHFADAISYSGEEEMSVELSLEDVKKVALHYGLKLQKERTIETTYTSNRRSMIQSRYFAAFWTMTKET